jgi:hypothetical protein
MLTGAGVVLPCDFETDDLERCWRKRHAAVRSHGAFECTVHEQYDCHSFEEIAEDNERERKGLTGLLSLEAEGPSADGVFGMPPLLQDLRRKVIGFFTLLATGRA